MMRAKKRYINSYINSIEPLIGDLIVNEQIHAACTDIVLGPMTITFKLRLLRPSAAQIRKVESLDRVFEQVLGTAPIRVINSPEGVLVELPSPVPMTPSALQLNKENQGLNVAVGYDSFMRPARIKLWDHGALYWVGPSRHGKTQSMKSTLYQLVLQPKTLFVILCLDGKFADWAAFAHAHNCMGIVTEPDEQIAVLEYIRKVFLKNATGYDLVILVDDLMALLEEAKLSPHLKKLSSTGAGLGVHLLVGTQKAGSKSSSGGTDVESNVSARIVYRATSSREAANSSGQGKSKVQELSGQKGDALLIVGGQSRRITTGFVRDIWLKDLQSGSNPYRYGWRTTATTAHNSHPVVEAVVQQSATAQQQSQQPTTAPIPSMKNDNVSQKVGIDHQGVAPVAGVVVSPRVAEMAARKFTIERRELQADEARIVAHLRKCGASWKQLSITVYGHKDGKTDAWIKAACESPSTPANPKQIDLTTPTGQATWQTVQSAVNWQQTTTKLRDQRIQNGGLL